jgi:hypothetical protein
MRMFIGIVFLILSGVAYSQTRLFSGGSTTQQYNTNVFNCDSGFSTSGSCGIGFYTTGQTFLQVGANNSGTLPFLSGSNLVLVPINADHNALNLNYTTATVNVQKFKSTFTFIPNGWNVSLVLQNQTNNPGYNGINFSSGAGCEGSFFQGDRSSPVPPDKVFAVELDSYSFLQASDINFTYSSVQWYQSENFASNAPNPPGQSPCNPNLASPPTENFTYASVTKISTSPVPLNSPTNSANTSTGDTYSATVTYDGSTLAIALYDVTASGTCTPVTSGTCFYYTWSGVDIPTVVGSNTAYLGIASGSNNPIALALTITGFDYYTP